MRDSKLHKAVQWMTRTFICSLIGHQLVELRVYWGGLVRQRECSRCHKLMEPTIEVPARRCGPYINMASEVRDFEERIKAYTRHQKCEINVSIDPETEKIIQRILDEFSINPKKKKKP